MEADTDEHSNTRSLEKESRKREKGGRRLIKKGLDGDFFIFCVFVFLCFCD